MSIHHESAFENHIEAHLLEQGGFTQIESTAFDRGLALFPSAIVAFIEATQPDTWKGLLKIQKDGLESKLLNALASRMNKYGSLDVLRHGLDFYGKTVRLAYFKPAHGLNPKVMARYRANRLTVTRQLHYSDKHPKRSLDLVLSLNGIPIVAAELKNPLTGQTTAHAREQYMKRNSKEPIFAFKQRALVHFAVDPDEVYMTTRLDGAKTRFLPFNQGDGTAAGNPLNPEGHRTTYLWEQVLERESLLDIVGGFLHLQTKEKRQDGRKRKMETLIFPRYHQLDVVRRLVDDARTRGKGKNYLIQHSAGSGKSNSIAWLAHRLSSLHHDDTKIFDSVVVITDRRVLDKQLQDTIYQFEHKQGVVKRIDKDSKQLAEALEHSTPIIITTLQKFPFVTEKIGTLPSRRYAVIVDEAHSSQSGEAAMTLKRVLGGKDLLEHARREAETSIKDPEELLLDVLSRGQQPNLSFFAFTATPKDKTLKVFGESGKPFHLYSMRQAIEEGFILDVLQHYTSYNAYFQLIKAVQDDPEVKKREAVRKLARFMSLHPTNIAQKTEVMVEHYREHTRHKIGGKAKAMVVTSSRMHAVRYKQAFDKYLKKQGYTDIGVLVAFSGNVEDEVIKNKTYTESGMNGPKVSNIPQAFSKADQHILIVANKFQTGFDQPLLHTMYVDKRLAGIQAVQTLSRLNRVHPGKTDTFVLDFTNERKEVLAAFQDYYEHTHGGESPDAQKLYELKTELEDAQVFWREEVEALCQTWYGLSHKWRDKGHAALNAHLDPAVDRFKALDEDPQEAFRSKLATFLSFYKLMSQIIPFTDTKLERLYLYLRMLQTKLPRRATEAGIDLSDMVDLESYKLRKEGQGTLELLKGTIGVLRGPVEVGTGREDKEKVKLSSIIDVLNDKLGTEFSPEDKLTFEQYEEASLRDEGLRAAALANDLSGFGLVFDGKLEELIIDRMERDVDIANRFLEGGMFQEIVTEYLREACYRRLRQPEDGESEAVGESPPAHGPIPAPLPTRKEEESSASVDEQIPHIPWEELLNENEEMLDARWLVLARGLRSLGTPPPTDCYKDIVVNGRTAQSALLLWMAPTGFFALVESKHGLEECTGEVFQVSEKTKAEEVWSAFGVWAEVYLSSESAPIWFTGLYGRTLDDKMQLGRALVRFNQHFNRLMVNGDLKTVNAMLSEADTTQLMPDFQVAMLRITFAGREKLERWPEAVERVHEELVARELPAERWLKGLREVLQ